MRRRCCCAQPCPCPSVRPSKPRPRTRQGLWQGSRPKPKAMPCRKIHTRIPEEPDQKIVKVKSLFNFDPPKKICPCTLDDDDEEEDMLSEFYSRDRVKAWCKGECVKKRGKDQLVCDDVILPVKLMMHGPINPFPWYLGRVLYFILIHLAYAAVGAVVFSVILLTRNIPDPPVFQAHSWVSHFHPIFCSLFNLLAAVGILMMNPCDSATFMIILAKRSRISTIFKVLAYAFLWIGTLFIFHFSPRSFYVSPMSANSHSTMGTVAILFGFSCLTFLLAEFKWGKKIRNITEVLYAIAFIFNCASMCHAISYCMMFSSFPHSNSQYRVTLVALCVFFVIVVVIRPFYDFYRAYFTDNKDEVLNIH